MHIEKLSDGTYIIHVITVEEEKIIDAFIEAFNLFNKRLCKYKNVELIGCCNKSHICDEDPSQ